MGDEGALLRINLTEELTQHRIDRFNFLKILSISDLS